MNGKNEPIVKDVVTQNEIVSKFSDFIGKDKFSTLASCSAAVGLLVEMSKSFTTINPMILSFLFSMAISGIRLVLSGDYTKKNIMLAVINIVPIALTASGGYDIISSISVGN